jgi:peptidoglycan hydrolase-like protein with peptidoglycan-binding domain
VYQPYLNGAVENGQPYATVAAENGQPYVNDGVTDEQPIANHSIASDGSDYGTPDTLIVSVQDALTRLGYATGVSDGRFGHMTETALSNFQRDHKLPVTGHIDGTTLRALGLL